jgi:hypothetical protein
MPFTNFAFFKTIFMISNTELIWGIVIAVVLAGSLAILFWKQRKEAGVSAKKRATNLTGEISTRQLQLQAYERLIIFTDRIALPNLVNRLSQPGISARDMQLLLIQTIKLEFEHNVSQQIYVNAEAWDAVRNFKEQNLLIINQVASYLPVEATGNDLSKNLLELMIQNPKASLHNVVSDALSYEAKKLMK